MKVICVLLTALGLAFGAAQAAEAQPQPIAAHAPGITTSVVQRSPHSDRIESHDKGMALLFWAFAVACVGGALFVITRRNLIAAVMGMVGSFVGIAAVYMMLYATFLAVVQMLVYAGAIMVLFVFVIMILNRPEDEPVAPSGRVGQGIGVVAIVYLVYRLALLFIHIRVPNAQIAIPGPQAVGGHDWGSVQAVGTDLFNGGLFPFEAISILLLVAVVGAIAIAKPLHERDVPEGLSPNDPRVEGHSP
ncbi:MAG: NADH-ubiquinone/plastoquinone oxidoreductase chain 6 [Myxococcales bacterium]|nr:NADH-ubiquinone/plastoquinone oxidoreductase chain 6 [Myxococcales bacterium]